MATLTGKTPAQTYKDLLQVSNNNSGVDSTLRAIEDGEGTTSAGRISTNKFQVRPASNGTDTFEVVNSSGSVLFYIDTTNNKVVLNSGVVLEGDGSGLTGVLSAGIGGASSTGNLEVQADSDSSGSGDIIFKIGTKEVARIPYSYASSLPTGVAGNYFIKTIADNWGNPKGGVRLDGVDDYYSVPDNDNLDFGTRDFSVELFIKTGSTLGAPSFLLGKRGDATSGSFDIQISSTSFVTRLGANTYTVSNVFATNTLLHLVASYDRDGNLNLYRNRILINSTSISGSSAENLVNAYDLLMFARYSGNYFVGEGYAVRLYNRALTQAEVTKLYNNGRPDLAELDYADKGASQTPKFDYTFDSNTQGFTLSSGDETSTFAWDTDHVNLAVTVAGTNSSRPSLNSPVSFSSLVGKRIKITFDYTVNSGTCILRDYNIGSTVSPNATLSGTGAYTIEGVYTRTDGRFYLYFNGTNLFNIDIDNIKIYALGCVAEYKGDGFGAMGLIDSSGNGLHGTSAGNPIALSKKKDFYKTVSTTAVQLVNTQKAGTILKQVKIKNITATPLTASLSTLNTLIATTSANNTLLNAVSVGASETKIFNIGDSAYSYASALRSLYVISSVATSLEVTLIYEEIE